MYTKRAELVFLLITIACLAIIIAILHFGFGFRGNELGDAIFYTINILVIILALIQKYYLTKKISIRSVDDMQDGMQGSYLSQYYIPLHKKEKVIEEIKNLGFSLQKEKGKKATYFRKGKNLFQDRLLKIEEDDQFFYVFYTRKIYDDIFMKYVIRYKSPNPHFS